MFTFFNYLFGTGEKRRKFFWPWRPCSIAHWTEPFTNDTLGLCFLDSVPRNRSSVFHAVTFSTLVITAILSPVAVSGNGLIMAAIWRKQSLRTPTYVLLRGLAFIYLCTGLIIQPFFCCRRTYLFRHTTDGKQSTFIPYFCCSYYFWMQSLHSAFLTVSLLTLMAVERWLHMARRTLLTVQRIYFIIAIVSLLLIPFAVFHFLRILTNTNRLDTTITFFFVFLFCTI